MSKVFDSHKWRETCEQISTEAVRTCGCIHDIYVANYSLEIENHVSSIPDEHRKLAYDIANEIGDYSTPEERQRSVQWNLENGYCRHGLTKECCPCGCSEL